MLAKSPGHTYRSAPAQTHAAECRTPKPSTGGARTMPVPDTHSNLRLGLAHPLTVEYGVRFGHGISQNHCLVEYRDNPLVAGQQFAIQPNLMEVSCADNIYQIFDGLTKSNVKYCTQKISKG